MFIFSQLLPLTKILQLSSNYVVLLQKLICGVVGYLPQCLNTVAAHGSQVEHVSLALCPAS